MGVMTATALVGTGISAFQTIKAGKEKKDAQKAMDNYNRQELVNPYENIKLSTYGTDVMREESARTVASLTDTARSMGARGAMGLIPKIQANANKVNQEIGMDLEQQDVNRQKMIAGGGERIMGYKEQRDNNNISALSSQYTAANEDFSKGLWGMASGAMSTMRGLEQDKENGSTWFNGKSES